MDPDRPRTSHAQETQLYPATPKRVRISHARSCITLIFSAAGLGTPGTESARSPCYLLLLLPAAQCRAHLAHRPLDAADREVNVHRDCNPQMLRHLITSIRLGFEQELTDDDGGAFLRSQLGPAS